ncbi:MAG TPA: hemolysin family protein [Chitinophagales bacterium]|nr:hemolysin family protein [Chitinophagales bacterium]
MEIIYLIGAILIFALFSGVEIVITSGRISNYKVNEYNSSTLQIAQKYAHDSTNLLITCLLVKLLSIGVVLWIVVNNILELNHIWWLEQWPAKIWSIIGIIGALFFVILAEYLPKSSSRFYADEIVPLFSFIVITVLSLFYYPSLIIKTISLSILKFFKIPTSDVTIEYTALDIERLIMEHQANTSQTEDLQVDTELFENILYLKNLKVRECMVPRNEITAIEVNDTIPKLKETVIESYHSRVLVYRDNIDNIIGYVHHFDLHKHPTNIAEIIIPIKVIPETMSLQILMNMLISENKSIAWVVNEYGGTAGVVTLEDILEEIFGEIEDEYDNDVYIEKQLSKNEFILSGRIEVDRVNEEYELEIPESEYETLSGMLVNHIGRIPRVNEIIIIENYHFKVLSVTETKIETVKLTVEDFVNNSQ